MVTTVRCSVISRTVRVLGTFTSMPDCSTGAVIIKITSSTRTTSTNGVMLMSASEVRVWPLLLVNATFSLPRHVRRVRWRRRPYGDFLHQVQQLAAKAVGSRCKHPDARSELVVRNHRWNGNKQTCGGCNQGFRNTRRDGAQRARPCCAQTMERIDNAHHGSKKTNERACGGNRRQPRHAALERGYGFAGCGHRSALERSQITRRA